MTGRHNQTPRCPMRTASLDARCGATPEEGRRSEPREIGSSAPVSALRRAIRQLAPPILARWVKLRLERGTDIRPALESVAQ